KSIGKPYAGKPHVRFDEEGLVTPALYSTKVGISRSAERRCQTWACDGAMVPKCRVSEDFLQYFCRFLP
ncbi:hypothetical protein, partial [Paenibacillus arenilitoris]|uniref:hypothetical protein n=1 Tax=Paenibacillus arenilitoris TaxID=2772299 RepID=UPI001CC23898